VIQVHITAELQADEYGPHEVYMERFELPEGRARSAAEAHARLLTLLVTERYFELPTSGGVVPLSSKTVREVRVQGVPDP
jgi:hypothetical protein